MLMFDNDYIEGAHPEILERLVQTNLEELPGYGGDIYCQAAKEKIRLACKCPEADVWFLSGGTQTNQLVIDGMLRPYQGVVSPQTGHINLHEAGAVEFTGHKVLALPQKNGKIQALDLRHLLESFYADSSFDHMVFPGMVYISFPTEYGTLYSKEELTAISQVCREYELPLFVDGARLGYGLMSPEADLTLPELAALCDVFYIGGTKVGALCGEAVVFPRGNSPRHFFTTIKQHGALLAKGRLVGIQFDVLFTDQLYFKLGHRAIRMAMLLKDGLKEKNASFYLDSPTNQQFVILDKQKAEILAQSVSFSVWEQLEGDRLVIRLATSWATTEEKVRQLLEIFPKC